jgi:hypothetical protein
MKRYLFTVLLTLLPFLAGAQINITNITKSATVTTNDYVLGTTGLVTRLLPVSGIAALATSGTVQTNISYTAVTNAPWQWGDSDLTNWASLGTNVLSTLVNQTNWPYTAITNAPWGLPQTNISYTAVTNAPWTTNTYQNISNIYSGTFDVRDFGAVADCVQFTNGVMEIGSTTLTCTQANWSLADVGKDVIVVDGMAEGVNLDGTITAFVSSTNVTISETCSNAISGQVFYGTDNSEAFQLALNAAATNGFGGAVYVENGVYLLNGDWRSNPGTAIAGSSKVQLSLPSYRGIDGTNMVLRMFGNVSSYIAAFPRTTNVLETCGAVLVCAKTAYDTTNYTIIGAPTTYPSFGFNYVRLNLENLTFRTQMGGQICPLNLKFNSQVELKNIGVDVGVTGVGIQEPRYETYGIIFPGLNNDIQTMVQNIRVMGFDTGMSLGECASYDQITSGSCKTGFRLEPMWHGFHVNYGYAINCATGVVAVPNTAVGSPPGMYVQWTTLETEDNSSGGWDDLYYDVYDPGSIMYGDIHLSTSGLGSARVPKCYGATNVTLHIPGQGVYNNYYSFGRLDTTNNISLFLGSTRAGATPQSDAVTYKNATLTIARDTGDTLLNARSGKITFYNNQSTVMGSVSTNTGFTGSGAGLTNVPYATNATASVHATNFWGQLSVTNYNNGTDASATTYLRGDGTWVAPAGSGDAILGANQTWTGINEFSNTTYLSTAVISNLVARTNLYFGSVSGAYLTSDSGSGALVTSGPFVSAGDITIQPNYNIYGGGAGLTNLNFLMRSNASFSATAPYIGFWNSNGQSLWIITATSTNFLGGTAP